MATAILAIAAIILAVKCYFQKIQITAIVHWIVARHEDVIPDDFSDDIRYAVRRYLGIK